jgi:hypothetical protein
LKFIKVIVTIAIGIVFSVVLVGCSDINYNSGNSYSSDPEEVSQMKEVLLGNNTSEEVVPLLFPNGGVLVLSNISKSPMMVSLGVEGYEFFNTVESGPNAFKLVDHDLENRVLYIPFGESRNVVFQHYTNMEVRIKTLSTFVEVSEDRPIIFGDFYEKMPDLIQAENDLYQIFFFSKGSEMVFSGLDMVYSIVEPDGEYIIRRMDGDLNGGSQDLYSETVIFTQEYVDKGYLLIVHPIGQYGVYGSDYTLSFYKLDEESDFEEQSFDFFD